MPRQQSRQKKSSALQHPLQETLQLPRFLRREVAQEMVEHLHRRLPKLRIDRLAFCGQLEMRGTTVARMCNAAHQAPPLQPVEHPGHRARVVRYALAQTRGGIRFPEG